MFAVEIGLIVYAVDLAHGWQAVFGWCLYGAAITSQVTGWSVALRPGSLD
jgi:hypothetical protein